MMPEIGADKLADEDRRIWEEIVGGAELSRRGAEHLVPTWGSTAG